MDTTVATAVILILVAAFMAAIALLLKTSKDRNALGRRVSELEKENAVLHNSLEGARKEAALSEEVHRRTVSEMQRMNEQYLSAANAQHREDLEAMKVQFKALAAEISSASSREFREQSAARISEMLAPVKERFSQLDRTMRESQETSVRYNSELSASIRLVMEQSRHVGEEARNLADALSGRSKVQGDFGEMLLKDILRNAGLQEGVHFASQKVMTDSLGHEIRSESGGAMIPDTLIFYPDDTVVVVDSKVSLTAFKNYMASSSAADRDRFAREHVESVRRHVDELKAKDYASYIPDGKRKVDYNIMFIPVEGAFRLMLETSPLLWQAAKDNNILIVSQMTLVIVLNMIQMSWKQAQQEANIEQVYKTASELMGQLQGWMSAFVAVGENLDRTVKSYAESRSKLVGSQQSVVRKIARLESLGLSPRRTRGKVRVSGRRSGPESVIPRELAEYGDIKDPAGPADENSRGGEDFPDNAL